MSINDGGPAFPMPSGPEPRVDTITHYNEGMSLRDYLAAKALPCAWDAFDKGYWACAVEDVNRTIAEGAYQLADAMLKAREAQP